MSDKYVNLLVQGRAEAERRISNWKESQTKAGAFIREIENLLRRSHIVGEDLTIENHGRAISITSKKPTKRHLLIRADTGQIFLYAVDNASAEETSVASCLLEHDESSKEMFFVTIGEHIKYLEAGDEWL